MLATLPLLENTGFPTLRRRPLQTLQVNLGYRCNQQCLHCHVDAGPNRKEEMARETVEQVLAVLRAGRAKRLDVTGGAPELNPHFRHLVGEARALGMPVTDRCNLTILEESGQEGLAEFLAAHHVGVVASLPCYLEENVDRQRGKGVFETSIRALQRLNALGYGAEGSGLDLSLVFNPQGPTLPPPQCRLEADYKAHLLERYGIRFNRLLTLANMPIKRFGSTLVSKGQFADYMALLKSAHLDANLEHVMCRDLVSVDWLGFLYDCDFNQMLDIPVRQPGGRRMHLADLLVEDLDGRPIAVADHCYGCTAGHGSSCGGALS
jgi:radical SAM/Cys-rich protein